MPRRRRPPADRAATSRCSRTRARRADGDPARAAERAELRAELGASLQELSPSQARVVVLKDAFDFSFEEISAASGMPVGTAKCYAHRARNGLREKLGPSDAAVA